MPRIFSVLTDSDFRNPLVAYWDFIKLEIPSPVGTKRFTNRPYGYTGNIDGSSQTWEYIGVEVGAIFQSRQEVLHVNWVKFPNVDRTFTNWAYTPGLRSILTTIYAGWFDPVADTFKEAYVAYEGKTDSIELSDEFAQIALRPHHSPWNMQIPTEKRGGKCINIYRSSEDCQYSGSEPVGEVTCAKTRTACAARSNLGHINIYDDAPKDSDKIYLGMDTVELYRVN